jgi:hypothetical protein
MRKVATVTAIGALAVTSGCSDATPAKDFKVARGAIQTVAVYDQTARTFSHRVRLQTPTRHWYLRADCVGKGNITISISGQGEGTVPCHTESQKATGYIGVSKPGQTPVNAFVVQVRAPKDSRWSAAVDAKLMY